MSVDRYILFASGARWFSRGMTILLGMLLLPVLFRSMVKEELGLWLLIAQTTSLLGILDFGFQETLTRRIAFAKAKSGSDPTVPVNAESALEIANLVATGLRIYRILAVLMIFVAFSAGSFYLLSLSLDTIPASTVCIAWGVICVSQAITILTSPWICLLLGVGYVGWESILASFVTVITLTAQILLSLSGAGIVSLAVAAAAGAFAQRMIIFGFAKRRRPDLFKIKGSWDSSAFHSMRPLAFRAWITGIGCSMIMFTDQFVVVSMIGTTELPAYRAAFVLVHNLTIVAATVGGASAVFVSHLWKEDDLKGVHRILDRNVRFGWVTMLTGAAVLTFMGESIFTLWLGEGNFIGYPILLAFIFTESLEVQSQNISLASRATEDEAFAWSTLFAGSLKLILSIELARRYGLLGIVMGTLIALLFTNHLYIPFRGLGRLRYSRWKFLTRNATPSLAYLAVICAVLQAVSMCTANSTEITKVICTLLISGMVFLGGLWTLVLDQQQRSQIRRRLRNVTVT